MVTFRETVYNENMRSPTIRLTVHNIYLCSPDLMGKLN